MAFALSWEPDEIQAGGFLLFDAITSWNRSFTGTVSKHPIDGGSNVSDHYINNNPVFTMSAVISASDVSLTPFALSDQDGNKPLNSRAAPTGVSVTSSDQSLLMKFMPNVIGQFLPDTLPTVVMDGESEGQPPKEEKSYEAGITEGLIVEEEEVPTPPNTRGLDSSYTENIQDILSNLQSGEGYNQITGQFETLIRPVTLYETDNTLNLVKKLPTNSNSYLVITSINFREDTESGYALYADITLEQVRFANLKKVQLPSELVQTPVKKKVATKKSLGKCDSTTKDTATSGDTTKSTAVDSAQDGVDPTKNVFIPGITPLP